MRGDIYSPFAARAKEYSWRLCTRMAPRNITPMDVDFALDCRDKFALFEMKTEGALMPYGQKLFYEKLLRALGFNRAILMVVEHPPLDRIELPTDVTSVQLHMLSRKGDVHEYAKVFGSESFSLLYGGFFKWAEGDSGALADAYYRCTRGAAHTA